MATQTDICNLALGRIGISASISSIDEPTGKEARECRRLYAMVLDRVLEAYNWPFARAEVELQDIGTPPTGWEYRYRVPADCVKARSLVNESNRNATVELPYIIVEDQANSSLALVCDESPTSLIYTKRITVPSLYSATFVSAFAWLLAAELVLPFSKDAKLITYCTNAFTTTLREAANLSQNSQRQELKPTDTYVSARQ